MNFFEEAALRLKQELGVVQDKQVAHALGLSEAAWKMRKQRGNFPEKELYSLAVKSPELCLDIDYVLTGMTREAHARLDANQAAGERAVARGARFSEGFGGYQNEDMYLFQRAMEHDCTEFRKVMHAWPTLTTEGRKFAASMLYELLRARGTMPGLVESEADQAEKSTVHAGITGRSEA
ncbi:MAG: hypothetical protein LBE22_07710 [Azoarcus sp.]|jgi:hypothetical protein|nr:hypothetical protein [Azoarcus sp.]